MRQRSSNSFLNKYNNTSLPNPKLNPLLLGDLSNNLYGAYVPGGGAPEISTEKFSLFPKPKLVDLFDFPSGTL